MNKKLGIGIVAIVAIVAVAMFAGCIEEEEAPEATPTPVPTPSPMSTPAVTPSPEPSPSFTPSLIGSPSPEPIPTEIPEPEYTVNLYYPISTVYSDKAIAHTKIYGTTDLKKGTSLRIRLYKIREDGKSNLQKVYTTTVRDYGKIEKSIDILGYGDYKIEILYNDKIYDTINFEMKKSPVILKVTSTKIDKEKYINYYAVSGRVKNRGTATAKSVKVTVRLYDVSGTLIGSGYTRTDIPDIPPDEESTFSLMIEKGDTPYERYEITASYSRYSW